MTPHRSSSPPLIIRTCRHILPSGCHCRGAAIHGRTFCRHHLLSQTRLHRMARACRRIRILKIALFHDVRAIRQATSALRISRAANRIDTPTWRVIAKALRMATDNLYSDHWQQQSARSPIANRRHKSKHHYHLRENHSSSIDYMPTDS